MTVQQLIDTLSKHDPDTTVVIRGQSVAATSIDRARLTKMIEKRQKYGPIYEYPTIQNDPDVKQVILLD